MKKIRSVLLTCLIILALLIIYSYWTIQTINLAILSDRTFIIGLLFLMIAAFISIFQSGFFDFFQTSMKKFVAQRHNRETPTFIPASKIFLKKPFYWFSVGVILIAISVICLMFL